ncbi:MAG: hypothetical protein JXB49_08945 [Bacteroidales bacterium]|nr:hypothetical protein [Bacteroidales bacterium]
MSNNSFYYPLRLYFIPDYLWIDNDINDASLFRLTEDLFFLIQKFQKGIQLKNNRENLIIKTRQIFEWVRLNKEQKWEQYDVPDFQCPYWYELLKLIAIEYSKKLVNNVNVKKTAPFLPIVFPPVTNKRMFSDTCIVTDVKYHLQDLIEINKNGYITNDQLKINLENRMEQFQKAVDTKQGIIEMVELRK